MLNFVKSESTIRPDIIDKHSSDTVFLRRNIRQAQREDMDGVTEYYEYEEAKLSREEYAEYERVAEAMEARQMRADIDYLLLVTGEGL